MVGYIIGIFEKILGSIYPMTNLWFLKLNLKFILLFKIFFISINSYWLRIYSLMKAFWKHVNSAYVQRGQLDDWKRLSLEAKLPFWCVLTVRNFCSHSVCAILFPPSPNRDGSWHIKLFCYYQPFKFLRSQNSSKHSCY